MDTKYTSYRIKGGPVDLNLFYPISHPVYRLQMPDFTYKLHLPHYSPVRFRKSNKYGFKDLR
ncbi:hypothetical protein ABIB30_004326 [Pedobacter sp. UYP1]